MGQTLIGLKYWKNFAFIVLNYGVNAKGTITLLNRYSVHNLFLLHLWRMCECSRMNTHSAHEYFMFTPAQVS
jgi:hypothetical protein